MLRVDPQLKGRYAAGFGQSAFLNGVYKCVNVWDEYEALAVELMKLAKGP